MDEEALWVPGLRDCFTSQENLTDTGHMQESHRGLSGEHSKMASRGEQTQEGRSWESA